MTQVMMLKNVVITFPALGMPQPFGEGDPAYGGKFAIDPANTALVAELDAAVLATARAKWKEDAEAILRSLVEDRKVAFEHRPYINKKTLKPYAGFEGAFTLGSRTPVTKPRPSVFNRAGEALVADGKAIATPTEIEQLIYSGCRVNAKVEFWAQDNKFGRRINCTLLGVMFAGDGERFGGGSAPAGFDDFVEFAEDVSEDVL